MRNVVTFLWISIFVVPIFFFLLPRENPNFTRWFCWGIVFYLGYTQVVFLIIDIWTQRQRRKNHMIKKLATMCVLGLICGCAASPSKIRPSYIGEAAYRPMTCVELAAERERVADALWKACRSQRGARTTDTIGMIVLCVPIGSVCGGNMTADIRRLKGELIAVENVADEKGCNLPTIQDPAKRK